MQRGQLIRRGRSWLLRYWRDGKRVCQKIAPFNDHYRTERSVRSLVEDILQPVNEGRDPGAPQTLQHFIEVSYLPNAREHKRPSTFKGYSDLYRCHVAPRIGGIRLREFRTVDGRRLLDAVASETKLTHLTLAHIKSFLSGVFTFAKRMGARDDNPMQGTAIPKGERSEPTYAYSLEEIEKMTAVLDGSARTAVVVAAFTGLSLGELRGLKWDDIGEERLTVRRTYWHNHEGPTKTHARSAPVPLLPVVAEALAEHRRRNPGTTFVFEGPRGLPLDLATLGSKGIKTALEGSGVEWYGFHALRRGLATTLHEMKVQDKTIQALLRHASLSVTMANYVKALPATSVAAMKDLGSKVGQQKR